tara:strand:+ start:10952 stop:11143 length:192 start_codon:yes stop_codon:yes gene_type:complete
MKLRYNGKCDARMGDKLFVEGDVGEFDESDSAALLKDGAWSKVETKTRKSKKAPDESQIETGS